jgi:hypothetical protein
MPCPTSRARGSTARRRGGPRFRAAFGRRLPAISVVSGKRREPDDGAQERTRPEEVRRGEGRGQEWRAAARGSGVLQSPERRAPPPRRRPVPAATRSGARGQGPTSHAAPPGTPRGAPQGGFRRAPRAGVRARDARPREDARARQHVLPGARARARARAREAAERRSRRGSRPAPGPRSVRVRTAASAGATRSCG